jgi:uncharacterized protein (TIGR00661 family)
MFSGRQRISVVKIFYGICGEGMGHAGRSIALIERLIALRHRVTIFTFADALRLLESAGYQAQKIEGLQFRQTRDGGVDLLRSVCNFWCYLRRRRESLDYIRQLALVERPDLFITDFEPLTALAAAALKAPCYSIDNQHRFCHPLGSDFPLYLQVYSRLTGEFVRHWIRRPRQCIVAVFHRCPPSRHYQRVDVLLRDRIARLRATDGEQVLLYGRGELGRRIASIASTVPERFIAYGCEGVRADNIEYKRTSQEGFAADLAACKAVVCTGGQQLIGEARYFGKPLLVVPIPNQHEQEINARYALREGLGDYCPISRLSRERIQRAVTRRVARPGRANGVDQTLDLLEISHG